jgi:penicillin-binding protein 1C
MMQGPLRLAFGLVMCGAAGATGLTPLPDFETVRAAHRPSDVTVVDRHGVPVQTLRTDPLVRRLGWVPLDRISPALQQALVLGEDRRFWSHGGVDWAAVARGAFATVWHQRTQGASTLTMQLAGLLDPTLARPPGGRSLAQKFDQITAARTLESRWRKDQILEAYLNLVPLRGELVGIGALSQTLFGKHPDGLDAREAAITAALVRGPNASAANVGDRACDLLQRMERACGDVRGLAAIALMRRGGMPLGEQIAPHFARQVVDADSPPIVRTTLDARLQRLATRLLKHRLAEGAGQHVEDGAVVVLDNASGEVLAWVGSIGEPSSARHVDAVLARRQPGSTIKPFVYALAFERRLITPASLLHDAPTQVQAGAGLYRPRNYDGAYRGWVSARSALASSLNVPALRVSVLLPPEALFQRLNDLGLDLPETGGFHGHALALGSAEVTLLALTNAYRTLARGGRHTPVRLRPDAGAAPRPMQVLSPGAAFLVSDILADPAARARGFGLDNALVTRGHAAVKTGTSQDMRDNWCIGYTDRHTVGVWVGNASGAPMRGVSGVTGAAPVWQALVRSLQADHGSIAPTPPAGVRRVRLPADPITREPARAEFLLAGTAPARPTGPSAGPIDAATAVPTGAPLGILHPVDGSVYAIDPDIPAHAQRLRFEGRTGLWVLNGRRLGVGSHWDWAPEPGRHVLRLEPGGSAPAQEIRFEVRPAGPAPR